MAMAKIEVKYDDVFILQKKVEPEQVCRVEHEIIFFTCVPFNQGNDPNK